MDVLECKYQLVLLESLRNWKRICKLEADYHDFSFEWLDFPGEAQILAQIYVRMHRDIKDLTVDESEIKVSFHILIKF